MVWHSIYHHEYTSSLRSGSQVNPTLSHFWIIASANLKLLRVFQFILKPFPSQVVIKWFEYIFRDRCNLSNLEKLYLPVVNGDFPSYLWLNVYAFFIILECRVNPTIVYDYQYQRVKFILQVDMRFLTFSPAY